MAEKADEKKRTVLIAMDGSKHAEFAFEWYVENVYKPDDEVFLAYCAESVSYPPTAMMAANPTMIQAMMKDHEEHVKQVLIKVDDLAKKLKVTHKLEKLHGYPGEAIVKAATAQNVDLIVVGSRGQGLIRRTIMGSISDYVIHHSHVPVMVCKHEDEHHKLAHHQ